MPVKRDPVERFWEKVDKSGDCWLWTGAIRRGGYGGFQRASRAPVAAHRYAYEMVIAPIPAGMEIDHLCRVRRCVNPSHLEAVSRRENWRRGYSPTAINAAKKHCVHGHPFDDANTMIRSGGGRYCRACRSAGRLRDTPERRRQYRQRRKEAGNPLPSGAATRRRTAELQTLREAQ